MSDQVQHEGRMLALFLDGHLSTCRAKGYCSLAA